jgi:hypothetical protein
MVDYQRRSGVEARPLSGLTDAGRVVASPGQTRDGFGSIHQGSTRPLLENNVPMRIELTLD